jgi:HPt (histidine-containing phosphotransfer) domain-containing protein
MQKASSTGCFPLKAQETKLERTLDLYRELYNAFLQERLSDREENTQLLRSGKSFAGD